MKNLMEFLPLVGVCLIATSVLPLRLPTAYASGSVTCTENVGCDYTTSGNDKYCKDKQHWNACSPPESCSCVSDSSGTYQDCVCYGNSV